MECVATDPTSILLSLAQYLVVLLNILENITQEDLL